jgi:hypothetical protein
MNKQVEKIKRQAKDEALKTGFVILGAVSGIVSANLLDKLTAAQPTLNAVVKYGYPAILAGGGFILSAATETNSKAKYFGYGLSVAGAYKGIQLIPFAKDYLQGVLGDVAIPDATEYLTENEERNKLLKGLGLSTLPVNNAVMQEAAAYTTRLPELETIEGIAGLGFNASMTDDADEIKGII